MLQMVSFELINREYFNQKDAVAYSLYEAMYEAYQVTVASY